MSLHLRLPHKSVIHHRSIVSKSCNYPRSLRHEDTCQQVILANPQREEYDERVYRKSASLTYRVVPKWRLPQLYSLVGV